MPNPYWILGASCAVMLAIGGAYFYGHSEGVNAEVARRANEDAIETRAMNAAAIAIANGLADLQVKQVTIQQRIEHDTRTNTVYRDCRHSPDSLRDLNAALTNTLPAGSGGVPAPVSTD